MQYSYKLLKMLKIQKLSVTVQYLSTQTFLGSVLSLALCTGGSHMVIDIHAYSALGEGPPCTLEYPIVLWVHIIQPKVCV